MILDGEIADGGQINEVHLSAALGISRTPTREALQQLVAENLVEVKPRRGFFVRLLTPEEFSDLYDLRPMLDPQALLLGGQPSAETIKQIEKAIRLRPFFPRWYYNILIRAHVLAGKYDDALSIIQKQLDRKPGNFFSGQAYLNRAVVYSNLGQQEKAKAEMAKALDVFPKMTLSFIRREVDCTDETFVAHYFETLEKLGVPE